MTSIFGFAFTSFLHYYLILQFLILCSWLGYGLYDSRWGRCVVTDIQWALKEKMAQRPNTESYIQYWVKNKMGIEKNEHTVDMWTTVIFGVTSLIGIFRYLGVIS